MSSVRSAGAPLSEFQRRIRGGQAVLLDHISKNMNELNLERCRCIPVNTPGADWRVLQQIVADDPSRLLYKVPSNLCIQPCSRGRDLQWRESIALSHVEQAGERGRIVKVYCAV